MGSPAELRRGPGTAARSWSACLWPGWRASPAAARAVAQRDQRRRAASAASTSWRSSSMLRPGALINAPTWWISPSLWRPCRDDHVDARDAERATGAWRTAGRPWRRPASSCRPEHAVQQVGGIGVEATKPPESSVFQIRWLDAVQGRRPEPPCVHADHVDLGAAAGRHRCAVERERLGDPVDLADPARLASLTACLDHREVRQDDPVERREGRRAVAHVAARRAGDEWNRPPTIAIANVSVGRRAPPRGPANGSRAWRSAPRRRPIASSTITGIPPRPKGRTDTFR